MNDRSMGRAGFVCVFVGLLLVVVTGCSSPRGKQVSEYRETAAIQDRHVSLSAGDVVELKFFYMPELNELQTIRPDGKLMLQLVGGVQAEGKTPEQLQGELKELYRKLIDKPEVAVMVRQSQSRKVYVGGAVTNPGQVAMPGSMTVLDAIMQAGGFKLGEANVTNVIVVRMQDGKHTSYSLDLESVLKGGEDLPFYVHSQDIVYVPRTRIVDVDDWVNQHLYKILPQVGLFVSPIN